MKSACAHFRIVVVVVLLASLSCSVESHAESLPAAMDTMARKLIADIDDREKQRVAVVDFCGLDGEVNKVGMFISEELTTRIVRLKQAGIVERKHLQKVMEEMKWQPGGIRDIDTAQKLGKFLGADIIVIGTAVELKTTIKVNARVIDIETGTVITADTAYIDRTPDIEHLMPTGKEPAAKPAVHAVGKVNSGGNFIINGDFSDRLNGWQKTIGEATGGSSQVEFMPMQGLRSGIALHIRHMGKGHIQFQQVVDVPGPELVFSVTFQAYAREGLFRGLSRSGTSRIALQYFDEKGYKLGETILLNRLRNLFDNAYFPGAPGRDASSYTAHVIEFPGNQFFRNYMLDIRQEIEGNLLGVNPERVRRIAVVLWCGSPSSQAGAELRVADLSLTATGRPLNEQ